MYLRWHWQNRILVLTKSYTGIGKSYTGIGKSHTGIGKSYTSEDAVSSFNIWSHLQSRTYEGFHRADKTGGKRNRNLRSRPYYSCNRLKDIQTGEGITINLILKSNLNLNLKSQYVWSIYIHTLHIYICICENLYAYIGFIHWEVKQMKAFGDWTTFFWRRGDEWSNVLIHTSKFPATP